MARTKKTNRRKNRKNDLKDLTHKQIDDAMATFLAGGGRINRIESTEKSLEEFLASGSGKDDADQFLTGSCA